MDIENLKTALKANGKLDGELVDNMINHYQDIRSYYSFGKYEEVGLHSGKFCENVANLILFILTGTVEKNPQLGNILIEIEKTQFQATNVEDVIRITIPRVLRAAYEMRSKRNTVHQSMEIDLNEIDSRVMVNLCSWIFSEFIRIYYTGNMNEAVDLIERVTQIDFPMIDDYQGKKLIMDASLSVPQEILIHLTNMKTEVNVEELTKWIPDSDINHIRTVLRQLKEKRLVYYERSITKITPLGADSAREVLIKLKFKAN